jgi:hypothetical protein
MSLLRALVLLAMCSVESVAQTRVPPPTTKAGLPGSYLLRGTVRDSATGRPVANAQIWPFRERWGVVSDANGVFRLRWHGPSTNTFIVRLCNGANLATTTVDFVRDSVVERDLVIPAAGQRPCTPADRLPWAVDARDTTAFRGHYIYSWEGGGWLEACNHATYDIDWDSALGPRLRPYRRREGQRTFVRFRGRIAEDRLGVSFPGPIFLVRSVEEVRPPRPDDCEKPKPRSLIVSPR